MPDITCNKHHWQTFWMYRGVALQIIMCKRQWYIRMRMPHAFGKKIPVSAEVGNKAWELKKRRQVEDLHESTQFPDFMSTGIVHCLEKVPYVEFPDEWFDGNEVVTDISVRGSGGVMNLLVACQRRGCRMSVRRLPEGVYAFQAIWEPSDNETGERASGHPVMAHPDAERDSSASQAGG